MNDLNAISDAVIDGELAKQIECNYINEYRPMDGHMGFAINEDIVLTEVSSSFLTTWFNGVLRADGSSPALPERMKQTIAKWANKAMMSWRVGVLTNEAEKVKKLLLSCAPAQINRVKAMALRKPIASQSRSGVSGSGFSGSGFSGDDNFRIEIVDNAKRLAEFMVPFNDPYCPTREVADFVELHFRNMLDSEKQTLLLGYLKEKPVSCAYYFVDSGVAMINGVSTLMQFRNRGFGRRIMEATIDDIFSKHSIPISLYARDMAVSMYEKIGFTEVYKREDYVFE